MSGTQCYTLSYFPSLTTGKRVRVYFTGEIPGGMGLGDRNGNTILSHVPWYVLASRELRLSAGTGHTPGVGMIPSHSTYPGPA